VELLAQSTQNPRLARELSKFIRERWNPNNRMPPLGIAETLDELACQLEQIEAELLAAQERHEEFKHVAMKEAELAQEERDSHAKAASEAMAREKALRDALERIAQPSADVLSKVELLVCKDVARAALAGSPSEKPGSEEEA